MELIIDTGGSVPPFAQLVEQIREAYLSGQLRSGNALPSIRQLANDLGLNANTVSRAYRLLERDAVIQTKGLSGPIVHPDDLRRAERALMQEMEKELRDAQDMQMDLLPKAPPSVEGVDISGICIPAHRVGGDYYTYVFLNEDRSRLGIILADVSGHGMRAATVAMRFREMLRYEAQGRVDPREILSGLDSSLRDSTRPEVFVTCGIGVFDPTERSMVVVSAGSPDVYHFRRETGEVQPLGLKGFPLGMPLGVIGLDEFGRSKRVLKSGDVMAFASDGVEEARDHNEAFYGQQRLMSVIADHGREDASAEELRNGILSDVRHFQKDVPQEDDWTVVILRVE